LRLSLTMIIFSGFRKKTGFCSSIPIQFSP
jgi:hypothetical protein